MTTDECDRIKNEYCNSNQTWAEAVRKAETKNCYPLRTEILKNKKNKDAVCKNKETKPAPSTFNTPSYIKVVHRSKYNPNSGSGNSVYDIVKENGIIILKIDDEPRLQYYESKFYPLYNNVIINKQNINKQQIYIELQYTPAEMAPPLFYKIEIDKSFLNSIPRRRAPPPPKQRQPPTTPPSYGQQQSQPNTPPSYGQQQSQPNTPPSYGQQRQPPTTPPSYGQQPTTSSSYGRSPYGQPQYTQSFYGQQRSPYGQQPYTNTPPNTPPSYGQQQRSQSPYGQKPRYTPPSYGQPQQYQQQPYTYTPPSGDFFKEVENVMNSVHQNIHGVPYYGTYNQNYGTYNMYNKYLKYKIKYINLLKKMKDYN